MKRNIILGMCGVVMTGLGFMAGAIYGNKKATEDLSKISSNLRALAYTIKTKNKEHKDKKNNKKGSK